MITLKNVQLERVVDIQTSLSEGFLYITIQTDSRVKNCMDKQVIKKLGYKTLEIEESPTELGTTTFLVPIKDITVDINPLELEDID